MTTDEIKKLGSLSRIALTEHELETFSQEIDSIITYVSAVKDIAAVDVEVTPRVGVRFNVLRSDAVTNVPGQYTDVMLAAMPHKSGQYLAVKKILKIAD